MDDNLILSLVIIALVIASIFPIMLFIRNRKIKKKRWKVYVAVEQLVHDLNLQMPKVGQVERTNIHTVISNLRHDIQPFSQSGQQMIDYLNDIFKMVIKDSNHLNPEIKEIIRKKLLDINFICEEIKREEATFF